MLLHDIPKEVSLGISRGGIFMPTNFVNALRAFKHSFRDRDVQILIENGVVIGAGCRRDGEGEWTDDTTSNYAEVEPDWLLWYGGYGNWLNIFNGEQREWPVFSWDWIMRIRHVTP